MSGAGKSGVEMDEAQEVQEPEPDPGQEIRVRAWEFIFECYERNQELQELQELQRQQDQAEETEGAEVST